MPKNRRPSTGAVNPGLPPPPEPSGPRQLSPAALAAMDASLAEFIAREDAKKQDAKNRELAGRGMSPEAYLRQRVPPAPTNDFVASEAAARDPALQPRTGGTEGNNSPVEDPPLPMAPSARDQRRIALHNPLPAPPVPTPEERRAKNRERLSTAKLRVTAPTRDFNP